MLVTFSSKIPKILTVGLRAVYTAFEPENMHQPSEEEIESIII